MVAGKVCIVLGMIELMAIRKLNRRGRNTASEQFVGINSSEVSIADVVGTYRRREYSHQPVGAGTVCSEGGH